jgi:gluconate 2-dehydrogenase alpha chain
MSDMRDHADVCVIGLGAAGATAAWSLASSGMKVVALEAGPNRSESDYRLDEISDSAYGQARLSSKFNQELQTWREDEMSPTRAATYSLGKMVNGVGGTVTYSGWLRRYQPGDFRIRTQTIERYGEDAIPEGASLTDWPIDYDDLEPYYTQVEQTMGVAGIPGNVKGQPVEGGNPFEGYRSGGYPLPPLRSAGISNYFADAARKLGYHPYPVPAALNSVPFDGRPACTYCGFDAFYGCHTNAKTTVALTYVPQALATGNLMIRTGCRAVRITVDDQGRASGVDYFDGEGQFKHISAKVIVLSAYTFENVRLLLMSSCDKFPRGLGNTKGIVGKYFTPKQLPKVSALLPGTSLNRFAGPSAQGMIMDDLAGDNFDHSGLGFIRGGSIGTFMQLQPVMAARDQVPDDVPRWGSGYKEHLIRNWNSIFAIEAQPEGLMYEENYLDLDPTVKDRSGLGLPVVRITYKQRRNELAIIQYLREKSIEILQEMGAAKIWVGPAMTGVGSSHDLGGIRMGKDPASSVVGSSLMCHDVENLYVMSGAVFPSCPGINPTLTIQALALRAADGIRHEWAQGRGM